jgi:hypothetical protein
VCASGQRQVCKDWKGEKRDGKEEDGEWEKTYNAKKRRKKRQERTS